jgi:hypothetical protein
MVGIMPANPSEDLSERSFRFASDVYDLKSRPKSSLYDCPTSGGEGGTRRGICQLHPVDAARLSGQLFSELRAAERPRAKYQQ